MRPVFLKPVYLRASRRRHKTVRTPAAMLLNVTYAEGMVAAVQGALKIITALQLVAYEFPDQACVLDKATYDYIIVGAGTTGCVIANRLVEDNKTTVLLIEAGGDPDIDSGLPALLLYLKQSDAAWNYTTEKDGIIKRCRQPLTDDMVLGKLLGGSSSTSYQIYTSGNQYDYNNWAEIVNDSTWNWKNVLPYFKKFQKLEDSIIRRSPNGKYFGTKGKVALTTSRFNMRLKYIEAFKQRGNQIVDSITGKNSLGYTDGLYTIGDGKRQSTAYSYLTPLKKNPNLHVLKNTFVKKIIFDKFKNAVGVEAYTYDKRYITVKCRKEVIVSAGVVDSPKLLMLSGIGPKSHLNSLKIPTISGLPVGKNLQDHLLTIVVFNMTKLVYPFRPWNPYLYPASVLIGYVSLNKSSNYPDYHTINYATYPQYLLSYCSFTYGLTDEICNNMIATDVNSEMIFTTISKQKYKSRGKILLKSKNFKDDPYIYTNYFSEKEDLEDTARILEDYVKVLDTDAIKIIGGVFKDPKIPSCKGLRQGSREYWKCYAKCMTTAQHHYAGTCAMGSVVDARLRVYGVKKLRVADCSVMPNPTAGGTLGPAIMIGEKVSDMIKEDNKKFTPLRSL